MNITSAQPLTFLQFPKMNLLKVSDSANFDQKDKVFNKRELYSVFIRQSWKSCYKRQWTTQSEIDNCKTFSAT